MAQAAGVFEEKGELEMRMYGGNAYLYRLIGSAGHGLEVSFAHER
jgi:hypothetical protein